SVRSYRTHEVLHSFPTRRSSDLSKYGINDNKPSDIERKIVDDILREFTAKEKEIREANPINNKAEVSRDINDVDTLLDEINDYKTLIRMFGDENKKYELAICEAKAKLKELTEGGR